MIEWKQKWTVNWSIDSTNLTNIYYAPVICQTLFFFFFLIFIFFFIYFWLCCVFVSVRGLSLVAASGGHSSSRCAGLSLLWPLLLRSTGSRRAGSAVVVHGPSCFAPCGIFPDQGSNLCPLHWEADSQPLHHQGSPQALFWWQAHKIPCPQGVYIGAGKKGREK